MNNSAIKTYKAFNIVSMLFFALLLLTLILYKLLVVVGDLGPLPIGLFLSPLFFCYPTLLPKFMGLKSHESCSIAA